MRGRLGIGRSRELTPCRLVGLGIPKSETSMSRRTIITALTVIVLVATVLMTYFGSMEDTVSPDNKNASSVPAKPAQ
jgi:hypothetical protein